ncbi:hypothetical protein Pmar_PMAR002178 [Perkinsus marinus ATCC 50983]|uniref:Uncharacterized protein n=1 Tax=Perkinsus marinus (strain ATCC 50983 / TXsc) TaxID=423536 RepID=C5L8V1_PERM5|nr:hypothetical protein Pmar_PMAR002178 [Perkinsus marinus ATCC 50983]EER06809.1 hypothetical protein Pmar_PMAR002178 [Perkinsus marinus ATCC 50983]|eukprot:XP_002774993.1 hypothetical protein Pmar_PMAR002178 [Perkinsus marinus ATCC 50983]
MRCELLLVVGKGYFVLQGSPAGPVASLCDVNGLQVVPTSRCVKVCLMLTVLNRGAYSSPLEEINRVNFGLQPLTQDDKEALPQSADTCSGPIIKSFFVYSPVLKVQDRTPESLASAEDEDTREAQAKQIYY